MDDADNEPTVVRDAPWRGLPEVAGYRLVEEIHRGGQGVVYKAVQLATKRTVALKLLLGGSLASEDQLQRFRREVDLVAALKHPGVVTIHDSGVHAGRPWYAMEYVRGRDLRTHVRELALDVRATLALFEKACDAVSHAHQRGVIHRDLKPSNILVDAEGAPRVLDFGLAKAATPSGDAPLTVTGEFMGTLAYASPEQAGGDPTRVDVRSDVYSLGVILYELLAGSMPYPVTGELPQVLRHVMETEPTAPSQANARIDNEVETIVLKALAKDRERRYQSADALRADITRYLAGEPIDAKRDSAWYVLSKTLRRYRGRVALVAVPLLVVLAAGVISSGLAVRLKAQRDRAERAEGEAREALSRAEKQTYRASLAGAQVALAALDAPKASELLDEAPAALRGWEWNHLHLRSDSSLAMIETLSEHVVDLTWSADGTRLWWLAHPYDAIWEIELDANGLPAAGAVPRAAWKEAGEGVLAFTADGSRVATASPQGGAFTLAIKDDGSVLASAAVGDAPPHFGGAECRLSIWDRASHRLVASTPWPGCGVWKGHPAEDPVRFPGRGSFVFGGSHWMEVMGGDFTPVLRLGGRSPQLLRARFALDGSLLAAWSWQGAVRLLDTTTLEPRGEVKAQRTSRGDIADVAWDSAGALTVLTWDGGVTRQRERPDSIISVEVRLQDTTTGCLALGSSDSEDDFPDAFVGDDAGGVRHVGWSSWGATTTAVTPDRVAGRPHAGAVTAMTFRAEGEMLVTGSEDGTLAIWRDGAVAARLLGHRGPISSVALASSRSLLASGSTDGTIRLWDPRDRSQARLDSSSGLRLALRFDSPSGDLCSVNYSDGAITCWNLRESAGRGRSWALPATANEPLAPTALATSMAILSSGDQPLLRIASEAGWVDVRGTSPGHAEVVARRSLADDTKAAPRESGGCEVARDGAVVHVAGDGVRITTVSGSVIACADSAGIDRVGWTDDGAMVVGWMPEKRLVAWDASSGRVAWRRAADGPPGSPQMLAAGRGARVVAGLDEDESILWMREGDAMRAVHRFAGWGVAFSPDDRRVAVSLRSGAIRILDGESLATILEIPVDGEPGKITWCDDDVLAVSTVNRGIVILDARERRREP